MNKLNKTRLVSFIFGVLVFAGTSCGNADPTPAAAPAPTAAPAATQAPADPTAAVARLSYIGKPLSYAITGDNTWYSPDLNRPMVAGNQLWTDTGGQAELQLSNAALRLSGQSYLNILSLQNNAAQFQLTQGTLEFRVWSMSPSQQYEIDTPNLAFTITQPGDYRVDIDSQSSATVISVNQGQGTVYGKTGNDPIASTESCTYTGTDVKSPTCTDLPPPDAFDQWCAGRNKLVDNSTSAQYVSPSVIGSADLSYYGTWSNVAGLGNVWTPSNVPANWAPFTQGHWDSIQPWGWTWVDDEPWGFAPFHYGRWTTVNNVWYWIPPVSQNPVYAPALVAFVGGNNELQTNSAPASVAPSAPNAPATANAPSVAWFPLGPGDVYVPPYPVSATYFNSINTSNAVFNPGFVQSVYANPQLMVNYHNYHFANAITIVPRSVFIGAQPVFNVRIRVTDVVNFYRAPISIFIHFGPAPVYRPALYRPPMRVLRPPVITRMKPVRPAIAPINPPHTRPLGPINPPHTRPLTPITPPHTRPLGPINPPPHTRPLGPVKPPHTQPLGPIKPPATKPLTPVTPSHKTAPMKPVTPDHHHADEPGTHSHPATHRPTPTHRPSGGGGQHRERYPKERR